MSMDFINSIMTHLLLILFLINFVTSSANNQPAIVATSSDLILTVSDAPKVWISDQPSADSPSSSQFFYYVPPPIKNGDQNHKLYNLTLYCHVENINNILAGILAADLSVKTVDFTIQWIKDNRPIYQSHHQHHEKKTEPANEGHGHIKENRHHVLSDGEYSCQLNWYTKGTIVSDKVRVLTSGFRPHRHEKRHRRIQIMAGSVAFIPCLLGESFPESETRRWFVKDYNGTIISENIDGKYHLTTQGLFVNISKNDTLMSDSGEYVCWAENKIANQKRESKPVRLVVVEENDTEDSSFAIKILAPAQKQMELFVAKGATVFLECAMAGNPPPLLTWEKYGGSLPQNRHSFVFGSLFLQNVTKEDEGSYLCKSEAAPGYKLDDYDHLPFVVYSLGVQEPVKVQMQIRLNNDQSSVQILCESTGGYATEIFILYNGRELLNDPDYKPKHVKIDGGGEKPVWSLAFEQKDFKDGIYQCLISNHKSVTSSYSEAHYVKLEPSQPKIILKVESAFDDISRETSTKVITTTTLDRTLDETDDVEYPVEDEVLLPEIVLKPENTSVVEGGQVALLCTVSHDETVTWLKHNQILNFNHRLNMLGSGTLEIKKVQKSDQGWYTCLALNEKGNTTADAYLSIDSNQNIQDQLLSPNSIDNFDMDQNTLGDMEETNFDEMEAKLKKQVKVELKNEFQSNETIDSGKIDNFDLETTAKEENLKKPEENRHEEEIENEERVEKKKPDHHHHYQHHKVEISRPKVNRLTNTSVLLFWQVEINNKTINEEINNNMTSPIIIIPMPKAFRVQYKIMHGKESKWTTIDSTLPENARSFSIDNLKIGAKYKFRIGAIFENGLTQMSKSSHKFFLMSPEENGKSLPISAPRILEINATSAGCLNINWQYSAPDASSIFGYVITYKRIYSSTTPGDNSGIAQNDTILNGSIRNYTLKNLLPVTPYEVSIFAFNEAGKGPTSGPIVQSTLTSDGTYSPLSFSPNQEKPGSTIIIEPGGQNGKTALSKTRRTGGLENNLGILRGFIDRFLQKPDHETILIVTGVVLLLVIILTIISTIAWTVTNKKHGKNTTKATKGKYRDASRRIHYEHSLKKKKNKKQKDSTDVASSFYATPLSEYGSSCVMENSSCQNGKNGKVLVEESIPMMYTSVTDFASTQGGVLNICTNPLDEIGNETGASLPEDPLIAKNDKGSYRHMENSLCTNATNLDIQKNRSGSVASFQSDRLFQNTRPNDSKYLTLPYNQLLLQQNKSSTIVSSAQNLPNRSPPNKFDTLGSAGHQTAILTKFKNQHLMKPSLFSPNSSPYSTMTSCSLHSSPVASPVKLPHHKKSIIDSTNSPQQRHRHQNPKIIDPIPEIGNPNQKFIFPNPPDPYHFDLEPQTRPVLTLYEEVIEEVFTNLDQPKMECIEPPVDRNQNLPLYSSSPVSTFRQNGCSPRTFNNDIVIQRPQLASPLRPISSDQFTKNGIASSRTSSNSLACSEALPTFIRNGGDESICTNLSPVSSFYGSTCQSNNDSGSGIKFQTFKPESRASTLCDELRNAMDLDVANSPKISSPCSSGSGRRLLRGSDAENSYGSS